MSRGEGNRAARPLHVSAGTHKLPGPCNILASRRLRMTDITVPGPAGMHPDVTGVQVMRGASANEAKASYILIIRILAY